MCPFIVSVRGLVSRIRNFRLEFPHPAPVKQVLDESSSSSYIFHGVGPLVDPFRSHVSRSLFKGLPDSFCQLGSSISLPFYLHVVSSFSCIPVICPKLVLFCVMSNTLAYPTQQSSSPSCGIPCSHKRGNNDRVTAV